MIASDKTDQQKNYERAYATVAGDYGMPDRKIVDGRELRGKRILALGCGTAQDLWYLTKDNEVHGLDYANSGLEVARRHGIAVLSGDLNREPFLPFEDDSFDVVVCKDILEHLLDPLAVAMEVRRVMRSDGYLVISVPNHFCLPMRLRLLAGRGILYQSLIENHRREYDEWNYMHIRFFSYAGFRRFLQAAGFKAEKWFWDFGNLAHYHQPEMWFEPQEWKKTHGLPLSRKGRLGLSLLRPAWTFLNIVFPRTLRSAIVARAPGLLCSGFYVRCTVRPAAK
jgi:SAM-dependent methyltransferase